MALVPSSTSLDRLSPTERRVCELVADGQLHKNVARALEMSPHTVATHLRRAAAKLPGNGSPTKKVVRLSFLFQSSDSAA